MFLTQLKYVGIGQAITLSSLNEFVRVHRAELKNLDPELYSNRGSSRAELITYLNDIIVEGHAEIDGGWIEYVPRLPPARCVENGATLLAIADRG